MALDKVRVQLLDENSGAVIKEVDVLTSADAVLFSDGETFQQKLDAGTLKGQKGDTGATGAQGVKGDTGSTGAAGQRGSQWFTGTGVTGTSTTGTVFSGSGVSSALVGDYYLNSSTGYVYNCTLAGAASVAKWAYVGSIKGIQGDQGPAGSAGSTGAQGATGATGQRGSQWYTGTGVTGTSTSGTVFSGSGVTSAIENDMYLNNSTGYVYTCTLAGAASVAKWVYSGSIKGATGATGATGSTGATGATGPKGDAGDSVRIGTDYATGTQAKLFFKVTN